jgi:hypothetical protein
MLLIKMTNIKISPRSPVDLYLFDRVYIFSIGIYTFSIGGLYSIAVSFYSLYRFFFSFLYILIILTYNDYITSSPLDSSRIHYFSADLYLFHRDLYLFHRGFISKDSTILFTISVIFSFSVDFILRSYIHVTSQVYP